MFPLSITKIICIKVSQSNENFDEEEIKKIYPLSSSIQSKLASIERYLISSHQKEKLYEESLAVANIKSDPNYFIRYAKKNIVCVLVILVLFMIKR